MLVHALNVVFGKIPFQALRILHDSIENAALAVHPAFFASSEKTVKQLAGDHFRRKSAVITRPAHISLDAFAERFLRDTDLQGAEARLAADPSRDGLIDRGATS